MDKRRNAPVAFCKVCWKIKSATYYQKNKERIREQVKTYSEARPGYNTGKTKAYYQAYPDKVKDRVVQWKKDNSERVRQSRYTSYRANLDYQRARARVNAEKRRARKIRSGGSFTIKEWHSLKESFENKCLCCGMQEPEISLHADHIIPLALGGSNDIGNIQPLCGPCNLRKGAKTIDYKSIINAD